MCVWSAYTGRKPAAPELFESLKKIEGLWAGYYTGIVTGAEGKLHLGKVWGNSRVWQEKYDLSAFPGTYGLAHSRTNSGGDERRSQPHLGFSGKVAAHAQGCGGVFSGQPTNMKWAEEALARGERFSSALSAPLKPTSPLLSDGSCVAPAEVCAHAVEYLYGKLHDPLAAVKEVLPDLTNESSTCFIFADLPGVIGFANGNQRMVYQRNRDGVYLSISTIGLPNGFGVELPCNSCGIISPEGMEIKPLHDRFETETFLPGGMLKAALAYIKNNPGCLLANVCDHALKPLFPPETLNYRVGASYRVLETLLAEGLVKLVPEEKIGGTGVPGTVFGIYAAEG